MDIVAEGEPVAPYLIVFQGWAAPYRRLYDGRRQFFDLLIGPDGLRGLRSTARSQAHLSLAALTDCHVWLGSADDLRRLDGVRGAPDFDHCQQMFIEQHERMLKRITVLGHTRAPERVAYSLMEIWTRLLGNRAVPGASCLLPITQNDIGDLVGLTAVHVCRTISTFKRLGIIRIEDGKLTVLRPLDLEDIACSHFLATNPH